VFTAALMLLLTAWLQASRQQTKLSRAAVKQAPRTETITDMDRSRPNHKLF
jgi:hypothetical protein